MIGLRFGISMCILIELVIEIGLLVCLLLHLCILKGATQASVNETVVGMNATISPQTIRGSKEIVEGRGNFKL